MQPHQQQGLYSDFGDFDQQPHPGQYGVQHQLYDQQFPPYQQGYDHQNQYLDNGLGMDQRLGMDQQYMHMNQPFVDQSSFINSLGQPMYPPSSMNRQQHLHQQQQQQHQQHQQHHQYQQPQQPGQPPEHNNTAQQNSLDAQDHHAMMRLLEQQKQQQIILEKQRVEQQRLQRQRQQMLEQLQKEEAAHKQAEQQKLDDQLVELQRLDDLNKQQQQQLQHDHNDDLPPPNPGPYPEVSKWHRQPLRDRTVMEMFQNQLNHHGKSNFKDILMADQDITIAKRNIGELLLSSSRDQSNTESTAVGGVGVEFQDYISSGDDDDDDDNNNNDNNQDNMMTNGDDENQQNGENKKSNVNQQHVEGETNFLQATRPDPSHLPYSRRDQYPHPGLLQERKQRLIQRLLDETQTFTTVRTDTITALAATEQLRHDVTQFSENLAFNQKQHVIMEREKEMLQHRFEWSRAEFNTALMTNTLLKEKIQAVIDDYKKEITLQSHHTKRALSTLDDTTYFYETISQLNAKTNDMERLVTGLKNDISILTSFLQHFLLVAFDDQGLPRSQLADVFSTLPVEDFRLLGSLNKVLKEQGRVEHPSNIVDPTIPSVNNDRLTGVEHFPHPVVLELRRALLEQQKLTEKNRKIKKDNNNNNNNNNFVTIDSKLATRAVVENNQAFEYFEKVEEAKNDFSRDFLQPPGTANVMDSFITKCLSVTGHFQPHVYMQYLRKQSDQLLLLQRSHSLLTSQIFTLQQEKALLFTYFESFLKETVSLKHIVNSNTIKMDDDTRAIYSLQLKLATVETELENMKKEQLLDQAAESVEHEHQQSLLENTTTLIGQVEKLTASLAVSHNTIHKLRVANQQQDEQIQVLEKKQKQSDQERADLLKIIYHLQQQVDAKK